MGVRGILDQTTRARSVGGGGGVGKGERKMTYSITISISSDASFPCSFFGTEDSFASINNKPDMTALINCNQPSLL